MAQCFAVLHADTLEVLTVYGVDQHEENDIYLKHLSSEDRAKCTFVQLPYQIQPWAVRGVRNDDGSLGVVFDSEKHKFFRMNFIRQKRNDLLKECDWTQFPGTAISDSKKAEWEAYRQALRDIPDNIEDPDNVMWPVSPQ